MKTQPKVVELERKFSSLEGSVLTDIDNLKRKVKKVLLYAPEVNDIQMGLEMLEVILFVKFNMASSTTIYPFTKSYWYFITVSSQNVSFISVNWLNLRLTALLNFLTLQKLKPWFLAVSFGRMIWDALKIIFFTFGSNNRRFRKNRRNIIL